MNLLPQEIIRRKRDGLALSSHELAEFFQGFLRGEVADYQMGAMLMAVTLRGMVPQETSDLTKIMRDSGRQLSWPYPRHQIVDKHSTGGIGDKTSLIILPLVLCEGVKVPMMAGRGLGHTGGTLDKLEAVGWTVYLTEEQIAAQMATLGGCIMGQTEQVVPLDRKLYAMRDVTATVESIPLIVGSILSKKLAEGIGGLVLDVKHGTGAFMATRDAAYELAQQLATVGRSCGLSVHCTLSDMNSPLGTHAGNALEVAECCEVLSGRGPEDTTELSIHLAAEMVRLAMPSRDGDEIRAKLRGHLLDGTAWRKFLQVAEAQNGDLDLLQDPKRLYKAPVKKAVVVSGGPFVSTIDTRQLGLAVLALGGGRRLVNDRINPWVGLTGLKRVGARLDRDEPVAIVHAADESTAAVAVNMVGQAYKLGEQATAHVFIEDIT
ncbi:MAG: thymidine phosphorylase [Deltaproteobacteria bacterium]|nr:thymidine phosphorylase [Deltaproteobacteria bacterium]